MACCDIIPQQTNKETSDFLDYAITQAENSQTQNEKLRKEIQDSKISIEWLKDKLVSEIKQIEIDEPQLDFAEVLHEQAQYDVQLLQ